MSLRAYTDHVDDYNRTHTIEIHKSGYSGSVDYLKNTGSGYASFDYEKIDPKNPTDNPIQKGALEFSLWLQSSALIDEIKTADEQTFWAVHKVDGTQEWIGYIYNDLSTYEEGFENHPFRITLMAKDFTDLGGKDYLVGGSLPDSRERVIATIAHLLDTVGFDIPIKTHTSWIEENLEASLTDYDYLNEIYHETKALREFGRTEDESDQSITVEDALTQLCNSHGLLLKQTNGCYWIDQLTEYDDPLNVQEATYDLTGAQSTLTTGNDLTVSANTSDLKVTIQQDNRDNSGLPGLKRVKNKYAHRTKVTEIGDFAFALDDSTTTEDQQTQLILSDGNQRIEYTIAAGASRTNDAPSMTGRYVLKAGSYYWDNENYEWTENGGTELVNTFEMTQTTAKPGIFLWQGADAPPNVETALVPSDADGQLTIKAYNANPAEESNYGGRVRILNPQAEENSTSINYQLTQTGDYSVVNEVQDTWFGDGPVAYSVGALRHGISDGDLTLDSWQFRGATSYRNFHENRLKEIMDTRRGWRRLLSATLKGLYYPYHILSYDSEYFYFIGGSWDLFTGNWEGELFSLDIQTGSDTFDDIPKFTEGGGSGTSSSSTSSDDGGSGIDQSTADARYFRQSQALGELATADIDTALTNLGLKDGSRDLDLNSLTINSDTPRINLNQGTNDLALIRFDDDTGSQVTAFGYDYAQSYLVAKDDTGSNLLTLADDPAKASGDIFNVLRNKWFTIRNGGNIGSGRQYLFMDIDTWSTNNGNAPVDSANNFHYYDTGNARVEFETDGEMAFYIEGGPSQDAWYGLQEGGTHHWSIGSDAAQNGDLRYVTGFGLGGTHVLTVAKDGGFGQGIKDPDAFFHSRKDAIAEGLHQSTSAHRDWVLEDNTDGVLQIASNNAGSVGTAIIMTGMETASDGRHWVIEHAGVTEDNKFGIGYYNSSATDENIVGGQTPAFTLNRDDEARFSSNVFVEGGLFAKEFVVDQTRVMYNYSMTPEGGKISSVSGSAPTETITFEDEKGNAFVPVSENAILRIQERTGLKSGVIVKSLWRKVDTISGNDVTLTDAGINYDSSSDVGSITAGDYAVQRGHTTNNSLNGRIDFQVSGVQQPYMSIWDQVQDVGGGFEAMRIGWTGTGDATHEFDSAITGDTGIMGATQSDGAVFWITEDEARITAFDFNSKRLSTTIGNYNIHIGDDLEDVWSQRFTGVGMLNDIPIIAMRSQNETRAGIFSYNDHPCIQVYPASGNSGVFMGELDGSGKGVASGEDDIGLVIGVDGDRYFDFRVDYTGGLQNAQIAGAFFDSTGMWAGGGATSDPSTKSDSNFWAKFDTGEFFYDAMVITVWARNSIAGFGAGSTADSLQNNEWTAQRSSSVAGENVIENKIKARYRHRFGINNMLLNYLIRVDSSGDGTGTGAVYLTVRDQSGTSVASDNIDLGPSGITEDTLEVDIRSLNPGQYYVVEVDLEAQVGNVNSGTVTITSYLREDAIIYATT